MRHAIARLDEAGSPTGHYLPHEGVVLWAYESEPDRIRPLTRGQADAYAASLAAADRVRVAVVPFPGDPADPEPPAAPAPERPTPIRLSPASPAKAPGADA